MNIKRTKLQKNKKNTGITLIALIITIIVLLILAGVTIAALTEENGMIQKAEESKDKYSQESAREKLSLALAALNTVKLTEEGRNLYLEELNEIHEDGISIEQKEGKVEIYTSTEEELKYAIANVDGYQFKIYENLKIDLIGKIDEISEDEDPGEYVQDGLIVLYDGENNTGNGHSNQTTVWKNLAPISEENPENQNNGTLMNFNFTQTSGWTENSLMLDGVNDWVKMSYLDYENMTIEIVAKPLDVNPNKAQYYLTNHQLGGMSLYNLSNRNGSQVNIKGSYIPLNSSETVKTGQIYSMSMGYDGNLMYFNENDNFYKAEVGTEMTKPESSTVFVIGTNPNGTREEIVSGDARIHMEVYSVRIYNRCLTEEEIKHNYKVDKKAFDIEKFPDKNTLGYVEDGLLCLYDGEYNTLGRHDNNVVAWSDLSGNGRYASLINFNMTQASGWKENALVLDGINDWVKSSYMHSNYMTIEIVTKPLSMQTTKSYYYLGNIQKGGISLHISWTKHGAQMVDTKGNYLGVGSNETVKVGQIYSLSTGYDRSQIYFRENNNVFKNVKSFGYMKPPESSTIFAIGTNPNGTVEEIVGDNARSNIEVYSARIYNRCLTEEEIQKNYQIDKKRFGL